jgi:hypothetical protein
MATIHMIDETTSGARFEGSSFEIGTDALTVRDLINLRVREEVRRYNNDRPLRYYGLVQPSDLEQMLNGPAARNFRPIDADRQVDVALRAFEDQRFIVLLPNGQAETLDDEVSLRDGDEVSFLRLVPLIGG